MKSAGVKFIDGTLLTSKNNINNIVTGVTSGNTIYLINDNNENISIDLPPGSTNTTITDLTFNNGTYDLTATRSDNVSFTTSLSILATDMTITGGTYDINTGIATFVNNSGGTFNISGFVSGLTDTYTTGVTYNDTTKVLTITNSNGQSVNTNLTTNDATPVGTIIIKASANVPYGYLYCNGQAVSRTTYSSLFSDIGTMYGIGDGITTFNLPDYRGYFLRGQNDGSGNDPDAGTRTNAGGGSTGDNIGTKQLDEFKSHKHTQNYGNGGLVFASSNPNSTHTGNSQWVNDIDGTFSGVINNTGGNETRPKNINVRYYIKY